MSSIRRRIMMNIKENEGGEGLPPESTSFEFPLYLNTKLIEQSNDYLYRSRDWDDILSSLYNFWKGHSDDVTDLVSEDILMNHPVYIDGYIVTKARDELSSFDIETGCDYGDYNEIYIQLDSG